MPTYPVKNRVTGEEKELSMTMKAYDDWRKENPDYHKEYDALRRPKRYCLDCGVEIPKGRFRCDTHWTNRRRLQWRVGQQKSYYLKKRLNVL